MDVCIPTKVQPVVYEGVKIITEIIKNENKILEYS